MLQPLYLIATSSSIGLTHLWRGEKSCIARVCLVDSCSAFAQEQLTALSQKQLDTAGFPEQVVHHIEQDLAEVISSLDRQALPVKILVSIFTSAAAPLLSLAVLCAYCYVNTDVCNMTAKCSAA